MVRHGLAVCFYERIGCMCVAMPGKVVEINDGIAKVDFSGNIVQARTGLVNTKLGDYVLVHAGCIIQVLSDKDYHDILDVIEEMSE